MEWEVTRKLPLRENTQEILRVDACGLKFIIWTISKFPLHKGDILTPVIDGYICNHKKINFLSIKKAVPFSPKVWEALSMPGQRHIIGGFVE